MPITLPVGRRPPLSTSPAIALFYGPPKVGKTDKLTELPNALFLDLERGTHAFEAESIDITNISEFNEALAWVRKENETIRIAKKDPRAFKYDFGIIDTIDMLEDYAERYCTARWNADEAAAQKASTKGYKARIVRMVSELDFGLGYGFIREEVKGRIEAAAKEFKKLILVCHLKDKMLVQKTGIDTMDNELSLSGKLGGIVASKCDCIGYVFRDPVAKDEQGRPKLMVNFETFSDRTTMGARHAHLRGKQMPLEWPLIYPDYDFAKAKD